MQCNLDSYKIFSHILFMHTFLLIMDVATILSSIFAGVMVVIFVKSKLNDKHRRIQKYMKLVNQNI